MTLRLMLVVLAVAAAAAPNGKITFSQRPSGDYTYVAELTLTGSTVRGTVKASHIVESKTDGDATIECDVDGNVTTVTRKVKVETIARSTLEKTVSLTADVSEKDGTVEVAFTIPAFRDGRSELIVTKTIEGGCGADETPVTKEEKSAPRPWSVDAREVSFSGPPEGTQTQADTTITWMLSNTPER